MREWKIRENGSFILTLSYIVKSLSLQILILKVIPNSWNSLSSFALYFLQINFYSNKVTKLSIFFKGENVNQCSGTERGYPAYEKLSKYEDEPGGSNSKRARTIFTAEQLEQMEREFQKQQYVVGHERMYLANALNLTEAQVLIPT